MSNENEKMLKKRRAVTPRWIYAFESPDPDCAGLLKVGYTTRTVEERMEEHKGGSKQSSRAKSPKVILKEPAIGSDGVCFTDHQVHAMLERMGIIRDEGEWFWCKKEDVLAAITAVRNHQQYATGRTRDFGMRPEQEQAVRETADYFRRKAKEEPGTKPRFLWNAKMRFGKTFAAYELAKEMGFKRILILTFKPAVVSAWEEDCLTHVDFDGWTFIRRDDSPNVLGPDDQYDQADKERPIVCFGSFQDFLGYDQETGGIKPRNEWVHLEHWDLVIFDEYHYGAWRKRAQDLFKEENEEAEIEKAETREDTAENGKTPTEKSAITERDLPIEADYYLYLSGTPFRSLASGEFIEEQVYGWTYGDEQRAKEAWQGPGPNPYAALPRMVMLTYKIPESIRKVAQEGEFDQFDLNVFFSVDKKTKRFVYEENVQQWLDFLRGHYRPSQTDALKTGDKPECPYGDVRLLEALQHTLWFLPSIAACDAMQGLLGSRANQWWHDYEIVNCAGPHAGMGAKALKPVLRAMGTNPLTTKTITLTCGKLTTGVTVRPWGGILMLKNLKSPETYFQAAFRVQSAWTVTDEMANDVIVKDTCYVLDFAPNRALRQVTEYCNKLSVNEEIPGNVEVRVGEFIHFLPILYSDGGKLNLVNAQEVMELADSGVSANLLTRRWQSPLLVNVDNETIKRILANEEAKAAIDHIEAFRKNAKQEESVDLEMIINRDEAIKDAKREGKTKNKREKRHLSEEEEKVKEARTRFKELLQKFVMRIPVFMYLTDDREHSLVEVIRQIETDLFKRVTGLTLSEFELLLRLKVFNVERMNMAVLNFKRYEDASLSYTGIDKHEGERIGLWDTTVENIHTEER